MLVVSAETGTVSVDGAAAARRHHRSRGGGRDRARLRPARHSRSALDEALDVVPLDRVAVGREGRPRHGDGAGSRVAGGRDLAGDGGPNGVPVVADSVQDASAGYASLRALTLTCTWLPLSSGPRLGAAHARRARARGGDFVGDAADRDDVRADDASGARRDRRPFDPEPSVARQRAKSRWRGRNHIGPDRTGHLDGVGESDAVLCAHADDDGVGLTVAGRRHRAGGGRTRRGAEHVTRLRSRRAIS